MLGWLVAVLWKEKALGSMIYQCLILEGYISGQQIIEDSSKPQQ